MPHQEIRVREAVRSPVPPLYVGANKTVSSALHDLKFVGDLQPWQNFLQQVEQYDNGQTWSTKIIKLTPQARDLDDGTFEIGDEAGVQGRFQQLFGEVLGKVLQAQSIDIHFADFKCTGMTYKYIPDVALIDGNRNLKIVGELKTPWVNDHQMKGKSTQAQLREYLAQPIMYMRDISCMYGFISTYDETVFLRQIEHQPGHWRVEYSPVISSSASYVKSNPGNPSASPDVSVKQCFLFLAAIASAQGAVANQTPKRNWVIV